MWKTAVAAVVLNSVCEHELCDPIAVQALIQTWRWQENR